MPDYKKLFYKSQAVLADTIEQLESTANMLKNMMVSFEDDVINDESDDENNF